MRIDNRVAQIRLYFAIFDNAFRGSGFARLTRTDLRGTLEWTNGRSLRASESMKAGTQ